MERIDLPDGKIKLILSPSEWQRIRRDDALDFERSVLPIIQRGRNPVPIKPWPKKPLKTAA